MKNLLSATLLLAVACGGHEASVPTPPPTNQTKARPVVAPPTSAAAREILESSGELGDYRFTDAAVTIPVKKTAMTPAALENARQLVNAGWLRFRGDDLEVAAKAQGDPRFLVRGNGFMDVVPVAKKQLGEVSSVVTSGEGIDVTFTWYWVPTEVGRAFTKGTVAEQFGKTQKATATLIHSGSTWSVLRIVEAKS